MNQKDQHNIGRQVKLSGIKHVSSYSNCHICDYSMCAKERSTYTIHIVSTVSNFLYVVESNFTVQCKWSSTSPTSKGPLPSSPAGICRLVRYNTWLLILNTYISWKSVDSAQRRKVSRSCDLYYPTKMIFCPLLSFIYFTSVRLWFWHLQLCFVHHIYISYLICTL